MSNLIRRDELVKMISEWKSGVFGKCAASPHLSLLCRYHKSAPAGHVLLAHINIFAFIIDQIYLSVIMIKSSEVCITYLYTPDKMPQIVFVGGKRSVSDDAG